jgi:hypothetical protein
MEKPELSVFWMENCLLAMGHAEPGVTVMPPERVTPPHAQFWKLKAIFVMAVLSPLTVRSNVPKSALAVQTPGWGKVLTLGAAAWGVGVGVADGAEGVEESPPHAVAAIVRESRTGRTPTFMTTSFDGSVAGYLSGSK